MRNISCYPGRILNLRFVQRFRSVETRTTQSDGSLPTGSGPYRRVKTPACQKYARFLQVLLLCCLLWTGPLHDIVKACYPDADIHNAGDCPFCQHGIDFTSPPEITVLPTGCFAGVYREVMENAPVVDHNAFDNPRRGPPYGGCLPRYTKLKIWYNYKT